MKHLLSVDQLELGDVHHLLSLAKDLEPIAKRQKVTRVLEGAIMAALFFEASTRTRVSFNAAFCRLGGSVSSTTGFTFSSMAKGETIYDTSRVISGYVDAMVIRHPEKGSVAQFAEVTNIPVVNAGDGPGEHPTQALLDTYTITKEFERLGKVVDGSHIVFFGDLKYGRTVHSLSKLLSLYKKLKFTFISPPALKIPEEYIELLRQRGHEVHVAHHPKEVSGHIDVIYATRIQKERLTGERLDEVIPEYQINLALVNMIASPDTIILHPLPRDSAPGTNDLSTDLNQDERLAIFRQTDNGIPVRMAIFAKLLGVEKEVFKDLREPKWRRPTQISQIDASFYHLDF